MNKKIAIVALVWLCPVLTQCFPLILELLHPKQYEDKFLDVWRDITRGFTFTCVDFNAVMNGTWYEPVNISQTNMLMFENDKFQSYKMPDASKLIRDSPNFDAQQPLIIFVHGFNNLPDEDMMILTARNYLQITKCNFLSYDISKFIVDDYLKSARLAPQLGIILFEFLSYMYMTGVPKENIQLVGFSMGAHISGMAARKFKEVHGSPIYRITALDPAAPCFMTANSIHLTKDDASYVDAIHTSLLSVTDEMVGHADYYVNGKLGVQPGCQPYDIRCYHSRSVYLYAASIISANFIAKQCKNMSNSVLLCRRDLVSNFGYRSKPDTRGVYVLATMGEYPYALGEYGILLI